MLFSIILLVRACWPSSWFGRALAVAAGWSLGLSGLAFWPGGGVPPPQDNRPLQSPKAGFVTSNDCRSCHPANYASWHASFHRTMTQLAKPANVIPSLDGLELTVDGTTHRVDRKGDAFFVRQRPVNSPNSSFSEPREIVLLTGSHHLQNFWIATGKGRTLEHFPFGWLIADKIWAPVGDTFLSPPEFHALYSAGDWNDNCIDCHTTAGRAGLRKDNAYDSSVAEFGIGCEACHGEGETHIKKNRNPLRRYWAHLTDRTDKTVANPARMNTQQSALVCGQCHSVWAFNSTEAKIKWTQEGAEYRPGQKELPERFVVQASSAADHAEQKKLITQSNPHYIEDRFWSDGMVRVTGREFNGVEASPCYKGGTFSCLSCHEMHPADTSADVMKTRAVSQMKPVAESDQGCIQCHATINANRAAHTHHAADSVGSHCYDCHMPHTTFGLMRALRSHQITSPSVEESTRHGRPNACNLCHLDKTLAWTAENLRDWYGQKVPILSADDRAISAGVKWILQGDAGQRALVAWSMGWAPAQKASGRDLIVPYLAVTLNDSYSAVRFVAGKSLQTMPGFESFAFQYSADEARTKESADQTFEQWRRTLPKEAIKFAPGTLLEPDGHFQEDFLRLFEMRNHRPIFLVE